MDDLSSKRIGLVVSNDLLRQVDTLAQQTYSTRSQIIRAALVEFIRKQQNRDKILSAETGRDVALERLMADFEKNAKNS